MLISAFIRYGMLDVPLERDEGEYAYAGQLILDGVPPYKELYTMKLPGIYASYAGILAIFGQTHRGIHLALLFINVATILLIFLLAKRLIGPLGGMVSAASFAVLSVSQSVLGVFANAEHFVILFAVGGLLVLLKALDEERPWLIFCGGVLLGMGFLMKQHGGMFVACGGLYTLITQVQKRPVRWSQAACRCALFVIGSLVPYGLTCLILLLAGVFENFWFWTVDYAITYSSQLPLEDAWGNLKYAVKHIFNAAPLLWILATIGLTALIWDKKIRHHWIFISLFTVFSFVAICPGFYFRQHYFILLLPAASLLAGCAISATSEKLSRIKSPVIQKGFPALLVVICLFVSVWQQRNFLFFMTPFEVSRDTYGGNPFPESLEIGRFLRENTDDEDRIAVIGSEPEILFYSRRRSATGHVYMYPLMEDHDYALQMQQELIDEVESSKPNFMIIVGNNKSWYKNSSSKTLIFEWLESYYPKHYTIIGMVEIFKDKTVYRWAPDSTWPPHSLRYLVVLKRKDVP